MNKIYFLFIVGIVFSCSNKVIDRNNQEKTSNQQIPTLYETDIMKQNTQYSDNDIIANIYCFVGLSDGRSDFNITIFGDGRVDRKQAPFASSEEDSTRKSSISKEMIDKIIAKAESIKLSIDTLPRREIHDGQSCAISVLGLSGGMHSFGSGTNPQKEIIELKEYILSVVGK